MKKGKQITILGNDFHHMRDVIRINQGDKVIILTPSGKYYAIVDSFNKNSAHATVLSEVQKKESARHFIVWQSILKGNKMDEAMDRITEMGATSIVPVLTERTDSIPKTPEEAQTKRERWQRIVISASKQARRDFVPEVSLITPLMTLLQSAFKTSEIRIFFWECSNQKNLYSLLQDHASASTIVLLIGPEGGFSPIEAARIMEYGLMEASLGDTVLRAENAGFFALGIVQYFLSMIQE